MTDVEMSAEFGRVFKDKATIVATAYPPPLRNSTVRMEAFAVDALVANSEMLEPMALRPFQLVCGITPLI